MPREIVHWVVLERACERLQGEHEISACVTEFRAEAFLGAMVHDAAYYYRFGGDTFEHLSGSLHGESGENTFEPIVYALENVDPAGRSQALKALLLGMLSHIATDVVFHPLVYFFTGNYHAQAAADRRASRTRHRLFEVYLDATVKTKASVWKAGSFSSILNALADSSSAYTFLQTALIPAIERSYQHTTQKSLSWRAPGAAPPTYRQAVATMRFCLSAFGSPPLGALVRGAVSAGIHKLEPIDALFSFRRSGEHPILHQRLEFQNPVTGVADRASVDELLDRAVDLCVSYFELFAPLLFAGAPAKELTEIGPSLNFGVPQAPIASAKFFSPVGVGLPGLKTPQG